MITNDVGILTYHRNYNYGWCLQCFALMTTIKSLGYNPILIDKRKSPPKALSKVYIRYLIGHIFKAYRHSTYDINIEQRGTDVLKFWDKYLSPRTSPIYYNNSLAKIPALDAYIVGSDQVWRPRLVNPLYNYFFDFVKHPASLISYAASFGASDDEYTPEQIKKCAELIRRFKNVSVREASGINLIKDVYRWDVEPSLMPDPTLLLTADDYTSKIDLSKSKALAPGGIFAYILDDDQQKRDALKYIEDKLAIPSYVLNFNDRSVQLPNVETWLKSIADCEFVFTDSFHGCVFALLFRKPFVAFGNLRRGLARFHTLLSYVDQSHRLILSLDDLKADSSIFSQLDKLKIDETLAELRDRGINFLKQSLGS